MEQLLKINAEGCHEALGSAGGDPVRRDHVSFTSAYLSSCLSVPTATGAGADIFPPGMVVAAGGDGAGARRTFGGAGTGSQPASGDTSSAGDDHWGRGFDDERVGGGGVLLDLRVRFS